MIRDRRVSVRAYAKLLLIMVGTAMLDAVETEPLAKRQDGSR